MHQVGVDKRCEVKNLAGAGVENCKQVHSRAEQSPTRPPLRDRFAEPISESERQRTNQ